MEKIIKWIKESNRYKHLIGGFIVGLCGLGVWTALYGGIVAGASLEYKDKAWGGTPDILDFFLTVVGATMASAIYLVIEII